jgi:hypothetical protein
MPQFDFFAWASISFWTVFTFHVFYLFVLRFVLSPIAELQKAQQKINVMLSYYGSEPSLKDFFLSLFFKKLRLSKA